MIASLVCTSGCIWHKETSVSRYCNVIKLFPEEVELKNIDKAVLKKPEEINVVEQTHTVYVEPDQQGTSVWRLIIAAVY